MQYGIVWSYWNIKDQIPESFSFIFMSSNNDSSMTSKCIIEIAFIHSIQAAKQPK